MLKLFIIISLITGFGSGYHMAKKSVMELSATFEMRQVLDSDAGLLFQDKSGNMFFVSSDIVATLDDIKSIRTVRNDFGTDDVEITLYEDAAILLADFTRDHINQKVAIIIDNLVTSTPKIMEEIKDGKIRISGLEKSEPEQIVGKLKNSLQTKTQKEKVKVEIK